MSLEGVLSAKFKMENQSSKNQSSLQSSSTTQIKRQTAIKVWLSNLTNGSFVKGSANNENFIPSYVECANKKISRVNIIS